MTENESKFKYFMRGGAQADAKLGHGPFGENSDTYVDAKPYVQYFSNGMFEGYDGSVWKYFRFPVDVQTEWLLNPEQALENQSLFIGLTKEFGQMLDSQTEKVRNDVRRDFHIQITQVESSGIVPPASSTPAHADYLSRISSQYTKPDWFGFIGVRLLPSDVFYEAHGFNAKLQKYWEAIKNPTSIRWTELRKDIDDVETLMIRFGFTPLDFIEHPEDLAQLTAWHGIGDEQHALPRQLQNIRMKEPIQGLSVIVPKWGEIQFHALKPQDGVNLRDPLDETSRWAVPLYNPSSDVVLVNIRGQVRAPQISDNLLDIKKMKNADKSRHADDDFGATSVVDTIQYARLAVNEAKLPMLDNLEIVVGSIVPKINKVNSLIQTMKGYNMEIAPLIGRQHLGVLTSFPTYPRHVLRIPRGNSKRPDLTNVMLPGMIAMSGLFRSTKPCAPGGILVGLSDAGDEFKEIYTETDAASKYNKVPGMLITGRPGAGKTQELLQIACQIAAQGLPVAFFNPKKEGTLAPTFQYIGGIVVSMNRQYLEQNPGMLDPLLFITDRVEAASLIADSIFIGNRMYEDTGSSASQRRTKVLTEIIERGKDERNRSSYDIIFGNSHPDPVHRTDPISDKDILDWVSNKVQTAPFWTAFIARNAGSSALRDKIRAGRSFLIEWDRSMSLPDISTAPKDYTDSNLDTVISVNVTFNYASAIISGTGGAIIVDESWVLKSSKEALAILQRGGREWRQANIMLIMATQRIQDWMDSKSEKSGGASAAQNMTTFFDRYLIMAISENDTNEIDAFFELTKQPRSRRIEHYMTHAGASSAGGAKGNSIPRAFYMDKIYGWEGGIICGPWPERELNLGRTDKAGLANLAAKAAEDGSFKGALAGVRSDTLDNERDLFAQIASEQESNIPLQ